VGLTSAWSANGGIVDRRTTGNRHLTLAAPCVRIPAFIGSNNAENNTCPREDAGERSSHGFAWAATHGFAWAATVRQSLPANNNPTGGTLIKFRPLSIMLLGVILTLPVGSSVAAPVQQTPEPPDEMPALSGGSLEEYPFDLKQVVGRSAASISAAGDTIDIAVSDVDDESTPKVALCAHNQYLVVYEKDGEIYGQRLDDDGDLLGSAFAISGDSYPEANPDVTCDWIYNTFIVVWDHDYAGQHTNYDIRAQAVHGSHQASGSQLRGSMIAVSQDQPQDERYPAIACNSNDNTCLVAFEYSDAGSYDIYGQRVYVGSSGYGTEGERFSISTFAAEEHNPCTTIPPTTIES
jgi:hypothetical protein